MVFTVFVHYSKSYYLRSKIFIMPFYFNLLFIYLFRDFISYLLRACVRACGARGVAGFSEPRRRAEPKSAVPSYTHVPSKVVRKTYTVSSVAPIMSTRHASLVCCLLVALMLVSCVTYRAPRQDRGQTKLCSGRRKPRGRW